jgi:hypothetical protein
MGAARTCLQRVNVESLAKGKLRRQLRVISVRVPVHIPMSRRAEHGPSANCSQLNEPSSRGILPSPVDKSDDIQKSFARAGCAFHGLFKRAVQSVISVSGEDAADGNELIRKRPSGPTAY